MSASRRKRDGIHSRALMLDAGLLIAMYKGFDRVSRKDVAHVVGLSESLLSQFWTAEAFHAALMERAIEERNLRVILQGIAAEHPTALTAPEELRRAALDAAL